jgi:hypothetical protein
MVNSFKTSNFSKINKDSSEKNSMMEKVLLSVKSNVTAATKDPANRLPALPTLDDLFRRVDIEYKVLRTSNMSKRDIVMFIQ